MKYKTTPSFDADWRRLKSEHRKTFESVVPKFAAACDAWAAASGAGGEFIWPASLRAKKMRGRSDIWEMTWSFASPDGRATFAFIEEDGEWCCLWRRIGGHSVYCNP